MFEIKKIPSYFIVTLTFFLVYAGEIINYFAYKVPYIFQYHFQKIIIFLIILALLAIFNLRKFKFEYFVMPKLFLFFFSAFGLIVSVVINHVYYNKSYNVVTLFKHIYYDKLISSFFSLILITILLSYISKYSEVSKHNIIKFIIILLSLFSLFIIGYSLSVVTFNLPVSNFQLLTNSSSAYQACGLITFAYLMKKNFKVYEYNFLFLINFTLIMFVLSKGAYLILMILLISFIIFDFLFDKKVNNRFQFIIYLIAFSLIISNFLTKTPVHYMHDKIASLHDNRSLESIKSSILKEKFFKELLNKNSKNEFETIEVINLIMYSNCDKLAKKQKTLRSDETNSVYKNNKLLSLQYNMKQNSEEYLSMLSRLGSTFQGLKIFSENPFFGIGNNISEKTCSLGTGIHSAIILILAKFGLVGILPIMVCFLIFLKDSFYKMPRSAFFICILLSILIFENKFSYAFVLFFLFGFKQDYKFFNNNI